MARVVIDPQELPGFGQPLSAEITWDNGMAVNEGEFLNSGRDILIVRNDDAGVQNFTIRGVARGVNFEQARDNVVTIAAGAYEVVGPFDKSAFNQSDGYVHVDFSNDDLYAAVIRLPRKV